MLEKTVTVGEHTITVRQATVLDGIRRGRLIGEGLNADESDPDRKITRVALYPAAMGALVTINPPMDSFETFCQLPEPVVDAWLNAIYELNPHWQASEDTPAEKKSSN